MHNFTDDDYWKRSISLFQDSFKDGKTSVDPQGITIILDVKTPRQFEQLNLLGNILRQEHVNFRVFSGKETLMTSMDDCPPISIFIPYEGNSKFKVYEAAAYMRQDADIIRESLKEGGTRQRILPHDPEYPLEIMTGVPWNKITSSQYGVTIVEPQLKTPITKDDRVQQEFAVGNLVLDRNISVEVQNWLEEQNRIETEKQLPPRTAVPADWASAANISRGTTLPKYFRDSIKKVFIRE